MKRLMLIGCVALGMAISPVARPAQALDGDELLGLVVGLGALAVIGNEIRKRDDKKKSSQPIYNYTQPSYSYEGRSVYGRDNSWSYRDRPKRRRALPGACLRTVETNRGTRSVLARHCLIRNDVRVGRLPERCAVRFDTRRGDRQGYRVRCLRNEGYRIAMNGESDRRWRGYVQRDD